jgi:ribosomal protein S18 acetylase RimI-like enzyme
MPRRWPSWQFSGDSSKETIAGIGQYSLNRDMNTADIALVVKNQYQKHGIGSELFSDLTHLARRKGLLGFTAEVLRENQPVFKIFNKMGFDIKKKSESGVFEMILLFKDINKIAGPGKPGP